MSPATKFAAKLRKATLVPSGEKATAELSPFAWFPAASVETRTTAPVAIVFTKMSATPLVSPATRLVARLEKATRVPSGEKTGTVLCPFAWAPAEVVDRRVTASVARVLRKTS